MVVTVLPRAFIDDHAVAKVFEEESQKDARHGDRSGGAFVCKGAQTGIVEHEVSVGEELVLSVDNL